MIGVLFSRFRQHRIAHGERRRHLSGEDRERKVPRADADKDPARLARILVLEALGLVGVIAQEVDRLAHLGDAVGQGLAGLAGRDRGEFGHVLLVEIGHAAQDVGALGDRDGRPFLESRLRGVEGCRDFFGGRLVHGADHAGGVGGRGRIARRTLGLGVADDHRPAGPGGIGKGFPRRQQRQDRRRLVDAEALGVGPLGHEQIARQRDRRVGHGSVQRTHLGQRVGRDRGGGDRLVDDLVHEGRVRAVFQQPPHEIGQQVAVRAHRRIDPAARALALLDDAVQGFAHAVQALEFKAVLVVPGHRDDGGAGVGVVGRELRIDPVAAVHQHLRAGHVAGVGVDLAGEDGETLDPHLLCQLDLGVPIGALDQTHHDLAVKALGHVVEGLDHRGGAAPVGLHDDAETVPPLERLVRQHRLDHVE